MTTIQSPPISKTISAGSTLSSTSSTGSQAISSGSSSSGSGNGNGNRALETPRRKGTSTSSSSSASSSLLVSSPTSATPANGGILNNAHEKPARKDSNAGGGGGKIGAAFKGMFKHPDAAKRDAGKQAKVDPGQGPLGKTFERSQPIPLEKVMEIKGPEVLDFDPRGKEASAGDGVMPPTSLKALPTTTSNGVDSNANASTNGRSATLDVPENRERANSDAAEHLRRASVTSSASAVTSSSSGASNATGGSSTSTDAEGSQYSGISTASSSIRFAPLPTSGRLKRANSITIGVAARSHLLQSQGSARQNYAVYNASSPIVPNFSNPESMPMHMRAPESGAPGDPQIVWSPYRDEVIDVGDIMQKGALKAWRKMRGRSASRESSASSASADAPAGTQTALDKKGGDGTKITPIMDVDEEEQTKQQQPTRRKSDEGAREIFEEPQGFQTPKRSASPIHMTAASSGAQQHVDASGTRSGTRTPLAGPSESAERLSSMAGEDAMPHITRRLSTGAFLRDQSLRQIQETRRKKFMDEDEEPQREQEAVRTPGHMEPNEQRGWISGLVPRGLASIAGFGGEAPEDTEEPRGRQPGQKGSPGAENEHKSDEEEFREAVESLGGGEQDDEDGEVREDDEDDEETREAERMAEAAMNSHSSKAMKAGAVEKLERRHRG